MLIIADTRDFDSTTYSRIQVQEYKKIYGNVIKMFKNAYVKNLWTPHLVIITSQLVHHVILVLPRVVGSLSDRRIGGNGWNEQVQWHAKAYPSGVDALLVPMKSCANLNQAANSSWDAKTLPTKVSPSAVAYKSMRDLQNS